MSDNPPTPPSPASPPQPAQPSPPPPPRSESPPERGYARSQIVPLLFVFVLLLGVFVTPYLVEQIQFSLVRGKLRAEAEVARGVLDELPEPENRYRWVAQSLAPAVVGVKTERIVRGRHDELSFLFGLPGQYRAEGQGSGVVIDESGYVLTNNHVVAGAERVDVELSDGQLIRDAKVVGADPLTDIAVLKIDAGGLTAAQWGDSDELRVGDPVLAMGSPFGLDKTVTAGIISAKGRRGVVRDLSYQDFLQTDAALNPGNSGGPLVDMAGKVVGINTAIFGRRYQGISFAIPSQIAHDVYEQLRAKGTVPRGWLGVAMQELNEELARKLGLESTEGALVADLVPGSPAEAAGLEPGDVIVRFNGEEITGPGDLGLAVGGTPPGAKAEVVFIRERRKIKVTVTVGDRAEQEE
jgi:serine protease Do